MIICYMSVCNNSVRTHTITYVLLKNLLRTYTVCGTVLSYERRYELNANSSELIDYNWNREGIHQFVFIAACAERSFIRRVPSFVYAFKLQDPQNRLK